MSKLEEKFGLKIGQAIALIILLILNVLWLVCGTLTAIKLEESMPLYQIVNIIMLAVAVFYACYGYKKPHGNYMRYLILCFSVFEAIQFITLGATYQVYVTVAFFAAIILTAYMSGRLDHYKQNVVISIVILICKGVIAFSFVNQLSDSSVQLSFVTFMGMMGSVTQWLVIAASYIIRYKPHKEAGLADK